MQERAEREEREAEQAQPGDFQPDEPAPAPRPGGFRLLRVGAETETVEVGWRAGHEVSTSDYSTGRAGAWGDRETITE